MTITKLSNAPKDEDDALDPAVERVRRKMMRLMGVSVAIMMVGLMAVIGAIFYKISAKTQEKDARQVDSNGVPMARVIERRTPQRELAGQVKLPEGAKLIDTRLNAGQVLMRIALADGKTALWVFDIAENRVFAKIIVE